MNNINFEKVTRAICPHYDDQDSTGGTLMKAATIEAHLGKTLSAKDISKKFNIDISYVRKNFHEFGGIKYGRRYRFFERRVLESMPKLGAVLTTDEAPILRDRREMPKQESRDINQSKGGKRKWTTRKVELSCLDVVK